MCPKLRPLKAKTKKQNLLPRFAQLMSQLCSTGLIAAHISKVSDFCGRASSSKSGPTPSDQQQKTGLFDISVHSSNFSNVFIVHKADSSLASQEKKTAHVTNLIFSELR